MWIAVIRMFARRRRSIVTVKSLCFIFGFCWIRGGILLCILYDTPRTKGFVDVSGVYMLYYYDIIIYNIQERIIISLLDKALEMSFSQRKIIITKQNACVLYPSQSLSLSLSLSLDTGSRVWIVGIGRVVMVRWR